MATRNKSRNVQRSRQHRKSPVMSEGPAVALSVVVNRVLAWFRANAREMPWRNTKDPYAIWISEVMLQQTQVATVVPYWSRWMSRFPDVRTLSEAPLDDVLRIWAGLGYYSRARAVHKAASMIIAGLGGRFPQSVEDLLELPGIGPYTAGAIASIAFNQPAPILDGNVVRVLARFHGITDNARMESTRAGLWEQALAWVSTAGALPDAADTNCSHLNQGLMELGATVCLPRNPECARCPLADQCVARRRGIAEQLPNLGPRVEVTQRVMRAFLIHGAGGVMVRQTPEGSVNAGLWEFPTADAAEAEALLESLCPGGAGRLGPPFMTVKHSITRYRIELKAFLVDAGERRARPAAGWVRVPILDLVNLPMSSAQRRLAVRLQAHFSGPSGPRA